MKKRVRITLTGVGEVVVEKNKDKQDGVPRCDNGYDREFYEELGVPENKIPQELKDREGVTSTEEDGLVEEIYSEVVLFCDQIKCLVEDPDGYTTIFLDDGLMITVTESALEIDSYLDYMEMSWFEKKKAIFDTFLLKLKWNRSEEKAKLDAILS